MIYLILTAVLTLTQNTFLNAQNLNEDFCEGLFPNMVRIETSSGNCPGPEGYVHSSSQEYREETPFTPSATADWTLMFYLDADCNLFNPLPIISGEVYSSDAVNVIGLYDSQTGPGILYYFPPTGNEVTLENLGEINMGDASTLQDFLEYGKTNYPAERYMLFALDHGGVFYGACIDITSNNDLLYMDEFQSAMENAGGIDLIGFPGSCLMSAIESAYELRTCADVYIGSEEGAYYNIWFGVFNKLCNTLNDTPEISTVEIGATLVDWAVSNITSPTYDMMTVSAIDLGEIEILVNSYDELCTHMLDNIDDLGAVIEQTRANAWYMGVGYEVWPEIDFYDFLLLYQAAEEDPVIQEKLQQTMDLFDSVIINEGHGIGQEDRAHGLNIWFPREPHDRFEYYTSTDLDFAENTNMDEFLTAYWDMFQGLEENNSQGCLDIVPGWNPFSGTVDIYYSSEADAPLFIEIRDLAGRRVISSIETTTSGTFPWDCADESGLPCPAGVYIISLTDSNGNRCSAKLIMR